MKEYTMENMVDLCIRFVNATTAINELGRIANLYTSFPHNRLRFKCKRKRKSLLWKVSKCAKKNGKRKNEEYLDDEFAESLRILFEESNEEILMNNIDEKTLKEEIKLPLASGISSKVTFNVTFMDILFNGLTVLTYNRIR